MSQIYDVIVIGGGPGGYTAALYAARANLSTLVLEKLTPGGQMGTTDVIDNYPGFPEGIGGFELAMQMKQGAERFGAKTELSEVISVELKGPVKQVRTQGGTYQARTVVLAHLSHENNTPARAHEVVRGVLERRGAAVGRDVALEVAPRSEKSRRYTV